MAPLQGEANSKTAAGALATVSEDEAPSVEVDEQSSVEKQAAGDGREAQTIAPPQTAPLSLSPPSAEEAATTVSRSHQFPSLPH